MSAAPDADLRADSARLWRLRVPRVNQQWRAACLRDCIRQGLGDKARDDLDWAAWADAAAGAGEESLYHAALRLGALLEAVGLAEPGYAEREARAVLEEWWGRVPNAARLHADALRACNAAREAGQAARRELRHALPPLLMRRAPYDEIHAAMQRLALGRLLPSEIADTVDREIYWALRNARRRA